MVMTCRAILFLGLGFLLWTSAHALRPPCPPPASILPCICSTRNEELQVWCTHSDLPKVVEGLKTIGEYISRPIDELIIEHNYLPALPGRAFRPLRALRLMLRHNSLERVAPGWLAGLEDSLMELFIVENDLRSLPVDSVAHMKKLQAITIESDQLKRLPSFARLNHLRYLKVQSSSLIELTARSFKTLPSLEKLQITGSPRLVRLESNLFHNLPRLTSVNISDCGLNWIHLRAMSVLPALVEVSFQNNKISDIGMVGRACRELPALATLRLDGNKIERIDEASFVDLPSLKELTISRNKIEEIFHGAFHKVPSLKVINLNYNYVQRVHPESFLQSSGSGVEELWLISNEIGHVSELRAILDALPRLKFLDMSDNLLEDIPYGALRGHPTLEQLHLDGNRIKTIEREAFMAMPALRELRLRNNSLANHIDGPFWNLPALKGLDLSMNYFRRLEPRLITNLPSLRRIDISDNEIAIIDPMTFIDTPLLEHINMSGNFLTSIHPATFRHLMSLYELDVSQNRLLEFVPGLPRGIEYIHMSKNQMSALPISPSPDLDLPSLRMLDISANALRNLPSGVMNSLPQLRRLDASLNNIQVIEEGSFTGLARLEMLDLHTNMISNIGSNVFKDMIGLTSVDLHGNILDTLKSDILREAPHLRTLDLSRNRLLDIAVNSLEKTRNLETVNLSSNYLSSLPEAFKGMAKLEVLDVSNNQMKMISPQILGSLKSLKELRLSNNKLIELKDGAFHDLSNLELLDLRSNELEILHSGSIRNLPALESLLLSENKLVEIPDATFAELQSLHNIELQNNNLLRISNNAFYKVPHMQFMNLSNNQVRGLESAGLRNVRSLEVLDLTNNKVTRVGSSAFEGMEWMVELKIDNNKICAVQGSPFNNMPRLKVLSLRNNKMTSLPEESVKVLHSNIAVLDIDGNPLVCGCSLAWFRAWLQEGSSLGPRCADGGLLKEKKLFRQDCESEKLKEEPLHPGCENEIIDPSFYGTSEVYSPWMEKIRDQSVSAPSLTNNVNMAPSPEESEYFYDEYVDYPFNETNLIELGNATKLAHLNRTHFNSSYHFTPGDTPTIYAAQNPNKSHSNPENNQSSGFTFFGMPLPSLNIGKLWGNGRKTERKMGDGKIDSSSSTQQSSLPSHPDLQSGGFVPLTPGSSGGFQPISGPDSNETVARDQINQTYWQRDFSSQNATTQKSDKIIDGTGGNIGDNGALFNSPLNSGENETVNYDSNIGSIISNSAEKDEGIMKNSQYIQYDQSPVEELLLSRKTENTSHIQDLNQNMPFDKEINTDYKPIDPQNIMSYLPEPPHNNDYKTNDEIITTSSPQEYINHQLYLNKESNGKISSPTPQSVLAVPGAPSVQYSMPVGRKSATITKVENPHGYTDSTQVSSSIDPFKLTSNRGGKTSFSTEHDSTTKATNQNSSLNWYYQNYNQSSLDPYVGPGVEKFGINSANVSKLNINLYILIFSYVSIMKCLA